MSDATEEPPSSSSAAHQPKPKSTRVTTRSTQGSVGHQVIEEEESDDVEAKYGASHVIKLFVPVSICMAMVVITMNSTNFYSESGGQHLIYTPFDTDDVTDSGEKFILSMGNAMVMLGVVIVMTFLLIIFYKYKCYKVIHGWLILSSFLLLFMFTAIYIQELMRAFNISLSIITVAFLLFNYGALGMVSIHWKGPLILQQFYLISMSALMALTFIKYLPDWTVWAVLGVISVWDLVAVLSPKGPLRILVETAQERNEPIFPALIYSSTVLYAYTFISTVALQVSTDPVEDDSEQAARPENEQSSESSPSSGTILLKPSTDGKKVKRYAPLKNAPEPSRVNQPSTSRESQTVSTSNVEEPRLTQQQSMVMEEENGVKLGLGDFIFYSVLVGKASSYFDWNTTLACYVAILVGLCFTLILLAVFKRALPALPISIFAGLIFYFATRWIITPFVSEITRNELIF